MIKAKLKPISIDNSEAFEDVYMAYLANKIVRTMVEGWGTKFTSQAFINKERSVKFDGFIIKVCLTEDDFYTIERRIGGQKQYVEVEDSIDWIERNVVGNFKK